MPQAQRLVDRTGVAEVTASVALDALACRKINADMHAPADDRRPLAGVAGRRAIESAIVLAV
jgi:hypothetical protein